MIAIYGLFEGGRCIYVGATGGPCERYYTHVQARKWGSKPIKPRLVVFRYCSDRDAGRIEGQVTRAYRRRGQAELSKSAGGYCQSVTSKAAPIAWRLPSVHSPLKRASQLRDARVRIGLAGRHVRPFLGLDCNGFRLLETNKHPEQERFMALYCDFLQSRKLATRVY